MSMYGYDVSYYDYGFSDQSIATSFYGNSISPMVDYDDEVYVRRRPPPRPQPPIEPPQNHRHDGTSPLPLGMDWSLPPRIWEGRNSVWPHDSHKRWSYCVAIPSWTINSSANGSDTVFFSVKIGIQSPQGITTTRSVQRRFNEFLKLYSELKKEFPKKSLPLTPPRQLMKTRNKKFLEERLDALEKWMQKLLSDIDVSRTAHVAIFLELEAAARQACCELNENESAANSMDNSDLDASMSEKEISSEPNYVNNAFEKEDIEELKRKCAELELKLSTEQDARLYVESVKTATIQQNEKLVKELDDAKEQINILRKQQDEVEVKAKSDVKLLAKEIKSLRTSHSDLKQELNKCLKEKAELEKEKQKWESGNSLLHECKLLHNRLRDCSVKFLIDEEDKPIVDTSLSDAIDLLETSDAQISLLLSEAKLIARDEDDDDEINKDDELRMLLGDILMDNVKLRKQVNSVIRYALSKPLKDDDDEDKLID